MIIAITQGGCGKPYVFDNLIEADEHPIIQYGDAFISDHTDIPKNYKLKNGLADLKAVLMGLGDTRSLSLLNEHSDIIVHAQQVWDDIRHFAIQPPDDHEVICNIIRQDRNITRRKHMSKADAPENKQAKAPRPPAFPPKSKIAFGTDKEDNAYGPKNNPKREGTNAAAMFALYKSGMTVEKALEAGITVADLKHNESKGFIVITPPAA